MEPKKILFLGNSITRHAPNPGLGWHDDCGMAASSLEKDYVHLLIQRLTAASGRPPQAVIKNIADFEREYGTHDIAATLRPHGDFHPDIAIIAIGENIPDPAGEEDRAKLRRAGRALFSWLKQNGSPALFVRSSFWPHPDKDAILHQLCQEFGGTWVGISSLAAQEANYARSERSFENPGVAAHPGDRGMAAIADALWRAMEEKLKLPAAATSGATP